MIGSSVRTNPVNESSVPDNGRISLPFNRSCDMSGGNNQVPVCFKACIRDELTYYINNNNHNIRYLFTGRASPRRHRGDEWPGNVPPCGSQGTLTCGASSGSYRSGSLSPGGTLPSSGSGRSGSLSPGGTSLVAALTWPDIVKGWDCPK